jgi:hypothetical protein
MAKAMLQVLDPNAKQEEAREEDVNHGEH